MALILAAAVLTAGTAVAGARDIRTIELAPPTTWGQMIGLTQDEIRTRLGLAATGETMATFGARLEDGQPVVETSTFYIIRAPCARPPSGHYAMAYLGSASLIFRAGKLTQVNRLGQSASADLDAPLRVSCTIRPYGGDSSDLVLLPLAVFTIPSAIGHAAADSQGRDDWRVFSDLRLGQSPPGGLEPWTAKHKDIAHVAVMPSGETRLIVKIHTRRGVQTSYAILRDGLVAELHPATLLSACRLQDDGSLACAQLPGH